MSSANLTSVKLNGIVMAEGGINAAIAGHFGVPILMVSGDDATIAEVGGLLGDIEGAVVKWNYGFHSARTLTPAIERIDDFSPYSPGPLPPGEGPITVDISFKHYMPGEMLGYLPSVERPGPYGIARRSSMLR